MVTLQDLAPGPPTLVLYQLHCWAVAWGPSPADRTGRCGCRFGRIWTEPPDLGMPPLLRSGGPWEASEVAGMSGWTWCHERTPPPAPAEPGPQKVCPQQHLRAGSCSTSVTGRTCLCGRVRCWLTALAPFTDPGLPRLPC